MQQNGSNGRRAETARQSEAPPGTPAPRVPLTTEIEQRAVSWIEPYSQSWHLVRARDWLVELTPRNSLEMRLAVVTHDIERMFPGGPTIDKMTCRWDDPDYLYAHASRSADVVEKWLADQGTLAEEIDLAELRRLITLHEFGGIDGADEVQAADSLSFLETLKDVVRNWVIAGECDVAQARAKHLYMADRIRIERAAQLAEPLLDEALASLDDLPTVA
jgi:hypothetical protein